MNERQQTPSRARKETFRSVRQGCHSPGRLCDHIAAELAGAEAAVLAVHPKLKQRGTERVCCAELLE